MAERSYTIELRVDTFDPKLLEPFKVAVMRAMAKLQAEIVLTADAQGLKIKPKLQAFSDDFWGQQEQITLADAMRAYAKDQLALPGVSEEITITNELIDAIMEVNDEKA